MKTQPTTLFLELECLTDPHRARLRVSTSQRDSSHAGSNSSLLSYGNVFAEIIAPYRADIQIVITDWTAIHASLADLRNRLPASVAIRVIGSIFLEELSDSSWSDYHSALATRFSCIQLWLSRHRPGRMQDWLALDLGRQLDDWPEEKRMHLVCGPLSDPTVQRQLEQKLMEHERS